MDETLPEKQAGHNHGVSSDARDGAVPPPSASWREEYLSGDEKAKAHRILEACKHRDHHALNKLAASPGGFIEDELRRAAWPILLGTAQEDEKKLQDWRDFPPHQDEEQVQLDVNRSFVYYPNNESDKRIDARKQELSNVITDVLRHHPLLCYFQGYHDIVQVLLLVLGARAAPPAAARLSLLRIRDFMLPTMTGALSHLQLLPAILHAADEELYTHLSQTAPFYFALPATLTLYAHDIQEYGDIARLFDFLLASEAVVSVYLYGVIVSSRKAELMELEADEHDMLHSILSKLPKPLDLNLLIIRTSELFEQHPPERLRGWAWRHISNNSVLKTTRHTADLARQTSEDGERYFQRHAAEIRAADARKQALDKARRLARKYRRPALMTGTAVLVALLALVLRRGGVSTLATPMRGLLAVSARAVDSLRRWIRSSVYEP